MFSPPTGGRYPRRAGLGREWHGELRRVHCGGHGALRGEVHDLARPPLDTPPGAGNRTGNFVKMRKETTVRNRA